MTPETVAIVVAVITTLGGGWSYLDKRKIARENLELQKHKVEAQAYDKARSHYDAIIDDLMAHVAWLKQELAERTTENTTLKARIEALEKTIEALRNAAPIIITDRETK